MALTSMRGRSHTVTGLSPHEVLTRRPMRMTNNPFPQNRLTLQGMEEDMVAYCVSLNSVLNTLFSQVKAEPCWCCSPQRETRAFHCGQIKRKSWKDPRWKGPYQVLLTKSSAVKVAERDTWTHKSRCRKLPEPGNQNGEEDRWMRKDLFLDWCHRDSGDRRLPPAGQ